MNMRGSSVAFWRVISSAVKFNSPLLLLAAWVTVPLIASAASITTDDFETYAPGSLAGGAAGTGWGGAWTVPAGSATVLDTTSSPLTYSVPGGGTIAGATRAAQSAPTAVNSGQITQSRQIGAPRTSTTYVSFLLQYSGTSVVDGNDTFSLYLSDGALASANPALTVGARAAAGTVTFMVRQGTGGPVAGGFTTNVPSMFAAGQTYLVVAQYVWDGTSFSTINAWLNPAYGESGTPLITQSLTAGTGKTSISHVFFRNYDNNNDGTSPNDFWTVDNLVIGDTWNDVVPSGIFNPPPSVSLTNPSNSAVFTTPTNLLLEATASDSNGAVTNLAFYAGAVKLADDTTEPYALNWNNVASGSYALKAVATDNGGASSTSSVVNITVTNPLPLVTLESPTNGATFAAPAVILLSAAAADSNGSVTNVAFYAGATKLADDASDPYSFNWTGVAAGSYALKAVATDNEGGSRTSAVVNITVTGPSALMAEDSFSYLVSGGGTLNGKDGGTGWAGAWVTNGLGNTAVIADATGESLSFTPAGGTTIDGSAEAVDISGTANAPVAYRQLANPQTGTFYVAWLMRVVSGAWSGTATFSVHLSNSGNNVNTLNFGARGGSDFMVRNGTGTPLAGDSVGGTLVADSTYYLVARLSKPGGSSTYDQIDMWLNPAANSSATPDVTLNLSTGTGLSSISHLIVRAAAMAAENVVRMDELKVGGAWSDVIAPWTGTPAVDSFTLINAGSGAPVPGYDPMTNNTVINLFLAGENLAVRANSSPPFDFGSVAFSLTGATTFSGTDNNYPWSLFGNSGTNYNGALFNVGAHSLVATAYDTDNAGGNSGIAAALSFTVVDEVIITNHWPTVTLTSPGNAATFTAPADLVIEADAADSDGAVTNVEFYAAGTKIGEAASAPYTFLWTNVTAGAYSLSARATDNEGATGVSPVILISVLNTNTTGVVGGELKKWHRVTVTWDGPVTSETDLNNPFRDYRLNVTLTHPASGKSYVVPGYFAADGDAANTSANSGDKWRVNFAPDETGAWNYVASFRAGTDVALSSSPAAGIPSHFDGAGGSFVVGPTDKSGRDNRAKGRLQYVGKHHLRFAETGEYFLKMGADSPENLLNYRDFDDQPASTGDRGLKSWAAHAGDYDAADAGDYTWAGGKGTNLLGAIKYLADQGLNAFSFIPFTVGGDDKNVCPHLLKGTAANPSWSTAVHHDRFDVSRMEQWDRIFAYGDKKGMYLHFKTLETENELLMDGGNLGPERILYYRELIARFGYHLALNWNLGEEINNATTAQKQSWSQYFYDTDPYRHHQVIHNGASHYDLLGAASHLTGFSKQTSPGGIFSATLDYIKRSDEAGVPWVVAFDEQNPADVGVMPDVSILLSETNKWHDDIRGQAIWSHLLAGGAGCEFYFGYKYEQDDLECQDFRSRDNWWPQCSHALEFFYGNQVPFWAMTNRNALLTGMSGTYCFARTGEVYVAYLPTNGVTSLNLSGAAGQFSVRWFNPRHGGSMQTGSAGQVTGGGMVSLGSPPLTGTNDWVVLVRSLRPEAPLLIHSTTNGWLLLEWNAPGFDLQQAPAVTGQWTDVVPAAVSPHRVDATNSQQYFRLEWKSP